jgi:hypothetical protein
MVLRYIAIIAMAVAMINSLSCRFFLSFIKIKIRLFSERKKPYWFDIQLLNRFTA